MVFFLNRYVSRHCCIGRIKVSQIFYLHFCQTLLFILWFILYGTYFHLAIMSVSPQLSQQWLRKLMTKIWEGVMVGGSKVVLVTDGTDWVKKICIKSLKKLLIILFSFLFFHYVPCKYWIMKIWLDSCISIAMFIICTTLMMYKPLIIDEG